MAPRMPEAGGEGKVVRAAGGGDGHAGTRQRRPAAQRVYTMAAEAVVVPEGLTVIASLGTDTPSPVPVVIARRRFPRGGGPATIRP